MIKTMHQASQKEVENLYLKFSFKVNTLKNYYCDTSKELPRQQEEKTKYNQKWTNTSHYMLKSGAHLENLKTSVILL